MMIKNLLSLFLFSAVTTATANIQTLPYHADWKYIDGGLAQDVDAGKPTSDNSLYNLGGWSICQTSGTQPFFLAITTKDGIKEEVVNTFEFWDNKQNPTQNTSFLVSPAFDFSTNSDKTISFKYGRENTINRTSNLEVLYSTDFTGDANTCTWISLKKNLISDTQAGIGESRMETATIKLPLVAPKVYIAIKADKDETFTETPEKQVKIRVTKFAVTEEAKENIQSLPYEALWTYQPEMLLDENLTLNLAKDPNAGTSKANRAYYELNGCEAPTTTGTSPFFLTRSKETLILNTLEFTDNKQPSSNMATSWIVTPALDFSVIGDKYISLRCGKENKDQCSSNLDLLYSTNYEGDVATAEWNTIRAHLIPADTAGLNDMTMLKIEEKINITASKVVIAIRAAKDPQGTTGTKQTKIRVKDLAVTLESIANGIEENKVENNATLFPNPAKEILNIATGQAIEQIAIYSLTGAKVFVQNYPSSAISIADLAAGSYIVRIQFTDGTTQSSRLIKE